MAGRLFCLQSWLRGKPGAGGTTPPTLVFVAHHDAFASVPVSSNLRGSSRSIHYVWRGLLSVALVVLLSRYSV